MIMIVCFLLALLMTGMGYVYVCHYFNDFDFCKISMKDLRLSKNRILFLGSLCITLLLLVMVFQLQYHLHVVISMKLITLVAIMFCIAVIDYRTYKVPNELLIFAAITRGVYFVLESICFKMGSFEILKECIIAALIVFVFFLLLYLVFKNSIGMGDIKLFAIMGLYQGLWGVMNSVFFSLVVSFFVSLFLLITRKKQRKDSIPFGPCILLGSVVSMLLTGM